MNRQQPKYDLATIKSVFNIKFQIDRHGEMIISFKAK